jgi:Spondin_N
MEKSMSNSVRKGATVLTLALSAIFANAAQAADGWTYEVSITNITYQQQFTPLLLVTHEPSVKLFELGKPASAGLVTLAEEGNGAPLRGTLDGLRQVNMTVLGSGLTNGGSTVTFTIQGFPWRDRLSVASMLIPTNDAFMAINAVELPYTGATTYTARAYDSGSEVNDEKCSSIPGPNFRECGGPGGGAKVNGGEGFVHIHRGIQGVGDLNPAVRTWLNPVAEVTVRRMR